MTTWVRARLCKLQKGALDSQPWFSPASSTTKTGRHDIAEILLKVALNKKKPNQNLITWFTEIAIYLLFNFNTQYICSCVLMKMRCWLGIFYFLFDDPDITFSTEL